MIVDRYKTSVLHIYIGYTPSWSRRKAHAKEVGLQSAFFVIDTKTEVTVDDQLNSIFDQIEAAYEKNGFFIDSFKNVIAHPVAHIHFNFSMDVSSYMERYGYNGYKAVYTLSEEEFEKLKNKFKKFVSDLHSAGYYFTRFKFAAYHPFDDRGELYPKYCEYIVKAWKDEPEPLTPGWKRAVAEPPPFLTLQQAFNNFELIE